MNRTIPPEPSRQSGVYLPRAVRIDDATDALVRDAGYGNRSRGVRELVRHWLRTSGGIGAARSEQQDQPRRLKGGKNGCVTLDDATDSIVREAGYGNRSRGVRELVRHWLRTHNEGDKS